MLKILLNKTEKPFSLQDDEKEVTIMTKLVKFSRIKQQPEKKPKKLPKQLPK